MDTVAIFNQKGGCGKTSLCVNLSAALYRYNKKKVLVMDCDAQNNAAEYLMRLGISEGKIPDTPNTIADYLTGKCNLSDIVYNVSMKDSRNIIDSGIDVIASGNDIDETENVSITSYRDMISKIKDDYDYCLIDCPPQRMPTALMSICAADYILIPIWTENDSFYSGYTMAVDLINDFRDEQINDTLKILGLVVTRTKGNRSSLDSYMLKQCREQFGNLVFDCTIRDAQAVNDAYMMRSPLVYYKKSAPVSHDYKSLASEFIRRINDADSKAGV